MSFARKTLILSIKIFFALIISAIPVLLVIQNDSKVQESIKNKIINILQNSWNVEILVESSEANFFTGNLVFTNGIVKAIDSAEFKWSFKNAKVRFSRLAYFFENKIKLDLDFYKIDAISLFEDRKLAIKTHINNIFSNKSDYNVDLNSLGLHDAKLKFFFNKDKEYEKNSFILDLKGSFALNKSGNIKNCQVWQADFNLKTGKIFWCEKLFFDGINGSFKFLSQDIFEHGWILKTDAKLKLAGKECLLKGSLDKNQNKIIIQDNEKNLNLKIFTQNENLFFIKGDLPFNFLKDCYEFYQNEKLPDYTFTKTGSCNIDLAFNFEKDLDFQGNVKFDKAFNDLKFFTTGNWNNTKNIGKLSLKNIDIVSFDKNAERFLKPSNCVLTLNFNKKFEFSGSYKFGLTAKETEKTDFLSGKFLLKDKKLKVLGRKLNDKYFVQAQINPKLSFDKFLYVSNGKKVVDANFIEEKNVKFLQGKIEYSFLKNYLPDFLHKKIVGSNAFFEFKINQNNLKKLSGSTQLKGDKLSVLGNYNPIEKINFDFICDLENMDILLKDFKIDFFKGGINIVQFFVSLDSNYRIQTLFCPVVVDDVLINWKKDFYGIVYGNLILTKNNFADVLQNSYFKLSGDLVLKRALFKENFFGQKDGEDFPKTFLSDEVVILNDKIMEFDINLINERSLEAKTPFLRANTNLNLNLHGFYFDNKIQVPKITGNIEIEKGTFNFLQHSLFINSGKIQFLPNQPNDPIIDFSAQNKIKKYLVTMQIEGSINNPTVVLESSPELSEEEILALLIAGSENASIQSNVSTLLLQNIKDLIYKNQGSLSGTTSIFKKLLLPFKYVQISPNFSDQSGRAGVKGTVSVDLNQQIHAQIQKNFNLQDDLAFQLEYFLTDNVNFKMVKDQSGEFGAELEVMFKL